MNVFVAAQPHIAIIERSAMRMNRSMKQTRAVMGSEHQLAATWDQNIN